MNADDAIWTGHKAISDSGDFVPADHLKADDDEDMVPVFAGRRLHCAMVIDAGVPCRTTIDHNEQ